MKRKAGVSAALVVLVATAFSSAHATSRTVSAPKLIVAKLSPVVVAGSGFRAGELVRVAVRADDGSATKSATASARGSIGIRFATLKLTNCDAYLITARGDEGSSARMRAAPRACGIEPRGAP